MARNKKKQWNQTWEFNPEPLFWGTTMVIAKVNVFYFYVFYADLFVCYFYKDPWWNHEPLLIDGMSKTLSAGDPDKPPH